MASIKATGNTIIYNGEITLRDWFAGQALPAIIRQCAADISWTDVPPEKYFSERAYAIADAMIAARDQ